MGESGGVLPWSSMMGHDITATSQQSPIADIKLVLHGVTHRLTEGEATRVAKDLFEQLEWKLLERTHENRKQQRALAAMSGHNERVGVV